MSGLNANQLISTAIWALVVLVVLIGAMVLLRTLLSRRRRQGERIGILERLPVTGDAELLLVRCDDREHLICLAGDGGFLIDADIRDQGGASNPALPPQQMTPPQAPPPASSAPVAAQSGRAAPSVTPPRAAAPRPRPAPSTPPPAGHAPPPPPPPPVKPASGHPMPVAEPRPGVPHPDGSSNK